MYYFILHLSIADLFTAFLELADDKLMVEYYNYVFFHTDDPDCASKFGTFGNSIAVFRNFDKSPVHYTGGSIYVDR